VGALDGRVAVITGAGRGIGRCHALFFAAEGASVVVNDLDAEAAAEVVDQIEANGGTAIADACDVAAWDAGRQIIDTAVDEFGDLHVLVNNAGMLRDRAIVNMSESEWDDVVRANLKGHFVPTRWAASYWRERAKAGDRTDRSIINTSSTSGLIGNVGQANYGSAKAAIASFTLICAQELRQYGVRSNAIAPAARTRLTETAPGLADIVRQPDDPSRFDLWDPANVSPLAGHLASESCEANGRVFYIHGGTIRLFESWAMDSTLDHDRRWTVDELAEEIPKLLS
jgi:NAD(P)-dependent dehydrogenase (short-subunit alcohol dehydrogenase family)